jgi:hypothetical protein
VFVDEYSAAERGRQRKSAQSADLLAGGCRLPVLAAGAEDQRDLEVLAEQIAAKHDAAQTAARTTVNLAVACGALLIEAKRRVGHGGGFQSFVTKCCGISPRSAQGYMRLARELERLPEDKRETVALLGVRDALSAVASDAQTLAKLPSGAVNTAIKEADEADSLRSAVSRQRTAKQVRDQEERRAAEPVYETCFIGGAPVRPDFASADWPAWRLKLQLDVMAVARGAARRWPGLTAQDICEALNDVYSELQESGLDQIDDPDSAAIEHAMVPSVSAAPSPSVKIDTGPITHSTRYAEVPADKRIFILGAWRRFFSIDAKYDCRETLRIVDELKANEAWVDLGFNDLEDMLRRGLRVDPQVIEWAVDGLRALDLDQPRQQYAAVDLKERARVAFEAYVREEGSSAGSALAYGFADWACAWEPAGAVP